MGKMHQEFVTYLVSLKYRLMNANEGGKISVLTIQVWKASAKAIPYIKA